MSEFDNDFSIDAILRAATGEDKKPEPAVKPIAEHPEHRAPHALTREEVLHVTDPHKPHASRKDFDAIRAAQEFVVFEQDVDPDAVEAEFDAPTQAPIPPAPITQPAATSFYERMKRAQAAQSEDIQPKAEPIQAKAEPIQAKTEPVQPKAEPPQPAKVQMPAAPIEHKQPKIPTEEIQAEPARPAERRHAASLSVEELMASVEQRAASKVMYKDGAAPYDPAAYTPPAADEEIKFAPITRSPHLEEKPAVHTVNVEYKDISSGKTEPAEDEPTDVESFSGAVFSQQTMKVTPVKRSRVFITPTDDGITTPATKVIAKEIPVNVDVLDESIATPTPDERIKEHNPYTSQYSLADADLPNQNTIFASPQIDKLRERLKEEKDIVSSATGNTILFDPVKSLDDDSSIESILPPAKEDWEDDLEADRRTKAESFKLFGDRETENPPEETAEEPVTEEAPEEPELTDYETFADAQSILADLNAKIGRICSRLIPTAIITAVLFLLATPLGFALRDANGVIFYTVNLLLLVLAAVINLPVMKGLLSLFTLRPDTDAPAALAVCATLIQSVYVCIAQSNSLLLTALGGLALSCNLLGKLLILSTMKGNFRMIADDGKKKNIVLLEDPAVTTPLAGGSVLGEAFIIGNRKVHNATGFLHNSYSSDPYEKHLPKVILLSLLASVAGGVVGFVFGDLETGLRLFAALLAIGCPITTALLSTLPMKLAGRRLNRLGAEITGFAAAQEIGYANAMTLDAADLFPAGTVNLYNMHILAPNPIDRSILEAAAIAIEAGSPLAPVFTGMIDHVTALPEVDTVKFEDKMGLSGWIGDKRIFIGNRTLMTAHNIAGLPSLDIDKRILKSGYFPIYLATTEGPCALFIVGYEADEEISYQLRRLTAEGVTLLINSCDQNLSEEMICDYFELYADTVRVMPPQAAKLYEQETAPLESEASFAACKSDAAGLAALLSASIRIDRIYKISLVLHLLFMVIGFVLTIAAAATGLPAWITALSVGLFQLLTGLITIAVPLIYRP